LFTLTKHQRLKSPSDFQRVYQSKQWGGSKHFTFNVLAIGVGATEITSDSAVKEEFDRSLLGVAVSKKVSKRAVDRNRIKRQVREFFRHHQAELDRASLVITAKPSCLKASDEQRKESLLELWNKVMKWQRWHQHQQTKNLTKA